MAQEMMRLVQSNPEVHGASVYESYKRMYAAIGVDNIEQILMPPRYRAKTYRSWF